MILITGATGNVGREAVKHLVAEGQQVVAVSRHPPPGMFPAGARVIQGDPSRPETFAAALSGIQAILLSPRAVGAAASRLLTLAAQRGVRRVVVLSALTVEYGGGYRRFADEFRAFEDAVKDSGLAWTLLRSADYAANAHAWAPQIRSSDVVPGAYGDAATSTIHERDIAAVAARALIGATHVGRAYVLTGPQSISQRDKVRAIGEAIGRALSWQEIPPEQVRQAMLARGLPEDAPDRLLGYLADHVQTPGPSSETVEQILQRPGLTFAEWATEHAAEFRNRM